MLRHDGLGKIDIEDAGFPKCARCKADEGSVRCTECVDPELYCDNCVVDIHQRLPLHRVQVFLTLFLRDKGTNFIA